MSNFDLKKCLGCAGQTLLQKFGRVTDFENLELIFSGIKGTEKPLSFRIIRKMIKKKYWDFADYWMIPGWWNLCKNLKLTKGIFKNLPEDERNTISILYNIFKNIEVVSIILRFLDPQNYGIISPPVKYALKQPPSENYIKEYMNYLITIRDYSHEYDFARVADADIALWALVEKCVIPKDSSCQNFKEYQEKIVEIEEEYIKKSLIFKQLEDELLSVAEEDVEKNVKNLKEERDIIRKELESLRHKLKKYLVDLIKLKKSPLAAEGKLIHDRREQFVDSGQDLFLRNLVKNPYVHKVIWSENTTAKPPTRISHVEESGEVTILYVTKNNYAAKIKVLPIECPDGTHAKYFASLISDHMSIPILGKK